MLQLAVKAGSIDETDDQQRPRPLRRAHGVQRQPPLQAGRADLDVRVDRRAPRARTSTPTPASTRRSTCSSCRPTSEGIVRQGGAGAGRFRRRADARSGRDRQGARRRHRGMARRPGRRIAAPRPADSGAVPQVEVRRAAADRQAGECCAAFTPDRLRAFYTKWYRPDRMAIVAVGDVDPAQMEAMIREEFGGAGEAVCGRARAQLCGAAASRSCSSRSPTDPEAHAVVRLGGPESAAAAGRSGGGLPARAGPPARLPDDQRALRRAVAQGPTRRSSTPAPTGRAQPDGGDRSRSSAAVAGRQARRRVWSTLAIESNRVREFGFGAAELDRAKQVDARRLRPRLQRARQDRERLVRPGVRAITFSKGSRAPASPTSTGWRRQMIPSVTAAEVVTPRRARCSPTRPASSWR